MNNFSSALKNWLPYDLYFNGEEALCKWVFLNDKKFTEPFFEETILKCRYADKCRKKINSVSQLDVLPQWFSEADSVQPSTFIFHVSRCGSTLATQLLALNQQHIVLSEVPFFDQLLQWRNLMHNGNEERTLQLLKATIDCYSQKRLGNENRLIIKTDSWHILFYQQFRKLYPNTPTILLYRKPNEVINSHQKLRGMHVVNGLISPELFGFDPQAILEISLDEYTALVLEKYYANFLHIIETDPLATLVNYNEGALAIAQKTAKAASVSLSEIEMQQIQERSLYHAKYPNQKFVQDVDDSDVPSYQVKAFELYYLLEQKRNAANK